MLAPLQAGSEGGLRSEPAASVFGNAARDPDGPPSVGVKPHLSSRFLTSVYSKSCQKSESDKDREKSHFQVFPCSRTKCKSLSMPAVFYRRLAQQVVVVEREPLLLFVENSKSPPYHL